MSHVPVASFDNANLSATLLVNNNNNMASPYGSSLASYRPLQPLAFPSSSTPPPPTPLPSTLPVGAGPYASQASSSSSIEEAVQPGPSPTKAFRVTWGLLVTGAVVAALVLAIMAYVQINGFHPTPTGVQSVDVGADLVKTGPPAHPNISTAVLGAGGFCTNCAMQWDQYGNILNASTGLPGGNVSLVAGQGITVTPSASAVTVALTSVGTPGTYAFPSSVTVDATGRPTAIVNGTAPVLSVVPGMGLTVSGNATNPTINTWFASVTDCGAVPNDQTDDTAAIQTCINRLAAKQGGSLYFPPGVYQVSSTLNLNSPNILLYGDGTPSLWVNNQTGLSDNVVPTALNWTGAAGGTILSVAALPGPTSSLLIYASVKFLGLMCNKVAGYGLSIGSVWISEFNVYVDECTVANVYTYCVAQLASHTDVQQNTFNIRGQTHVPGAIGVWLTGNASALPFGGDTSENVFENIFMSVGPNNTGLWVGCTDHNLFYQVGTGSFSTMAAGYYPIVFQANMGNGNCNAHSNRVYYAGTGHGAPYYQGTEVPGSLGPSTSNAIDKLLTIGFVPTFGTGAGASGSNSYCTDTLACTNRPVWNLAVADNPGTVDAAQAAMTTEALRITSDSSNHIKLSDYTNAAYNWSINVDAGTTNLRFLCSNTSAAALFTPAVGAANGIAISSSTSATQQALNALGTTSLYIANGASNHLKLVTFNPAITWSINNDATTGNLRILPGVGGNATLIQSGLEVGAWANIGHQLPPSDTTNGALTAVNGHFTGSVDMAGPVTGADTFFWLRSNLVGLQTMSWFFSSATVSAPSGTIVACVATPQTSGSSSNALFATGSTVPSGVTHAYVGVWNAGNTGLLYQSDDMASAITAANTAVTATFVANGPVVFTAGQQYFIGLVYVATTSPGAAGQTFINAIANRATPFRTGHPNNILTSGGYSSGALPNTLSSAGSQCPYIEFL